LPASYRVVGQQGICPPEKRIMTKGNRNSQNLGFEDWRDGDCNEPILTVTVVNTALQG